MEGKMDTKINFWIPNEELTWLKAEAKRQGRTMSGMIRFLIMQLRQQAEKEEAQSKAS